MAPLLVTGTVLPDGNAPVSNAEALVEADPTMTPHAIVRFVGASASTAAQMLAWLNRWIKTKDGEPDGAAPQSLTSSEFRSL
jgi:hypothetical protein